MPKNNDHKTRPEQQGRVQVPAMYLHPETLKTIDRIKDQMRVNRGIAIDELVRRYNSAIERSLRSNPELIDA